MPSNNKKNTLAKPAKKDKVKSPKRHGAQTSPKKSGAQTLKRSFALSSSEAKKVVPETPEDINKVHQSGFLSYLNSAKVSAKADISNQATTILASYKRMSAAEKRSMVTSFFQKGGRRSGLEALYQTIITMEDTTTEGSWSGWATPMMIMKWYEVGGFKKNKPPTPSKKEHW